MRTECNLKSNFASSNFRNSITNPATLENRQAMKEKNGAS